MSTQWITVCNTQDLVDNSGVCALVNEQQVAIFKVSSANDEQVYAISNWDPIGHANVLYRGLLGSAKNLTFVASPLYKQRYCLVSGQCLDNNGYKVQIYPVRIVDKNVQLQLAG